MVTTLKIPKWRPSAQVSDFIYIFLKKLSKTTKNKYKHEFSKKNWRHLNRFKICVINQRTVVWKLLAIGKIARFLSSKNRGGGGEVKTSPHPSPRPSCLLGLKDNSYQRSKFKRLQVHYWKMEKSLHVHTKVHAMMFRTNENTSHVSYQGRNKGKGGPW